MSNLSCADLLNVTEVSDGILVRFNDRELHETNARDLAEEVFDAANRGNGPHLYLDFAGVEMVSSYVMLRLIVLDKKLQDLGDRLVLLHTPSRVREALQATQMVCMR
jgi:anti-anti-sigma regulatory factor